MSDQKSEREHFLDEAAVPLYEILYTLKDLEKKLNGVKHAAGKTEQLHELLSQIANLADKLDEDLYAR